MNRTIPAALVAAALTAFSVAAVQPPDAPQDTSAPSTPPPPAADDPLLRRLAEIDERTARIADLRAGFEQRKHTPLLREPLVSSGSLLVKGDRVRWDTRRPRPSTMTIGGGEVRIYYPDASVVEVYQAEGDLRELSGSPLPRLAALRGRFSVAELDPAVLGAKGEAGGLLALELTPITEDLREHIAHIRVLLDTATPCVVKLEMTDPDGERTEIVFRDVRINTGVTDAELELRLPEGTRTSRPGGASGTRSGGGRAP